MDEAAFNALYQRSYHRIAAHVYLMCGNLNEAEECAQEAFAVAWQSRGSLRVDDHPEAWLRTVARRVSIGRWRKARRMVSVPEPLDRPAEAGDPIDRIAVQRALAELPVAQREAIVLHHFCDLPIADIAAETGNPEGTVKARLARGRAKLAQLLGEGDAAVSAALQEIAQPAYGLVRPTLEQIKQRRVAGQRRRTVFGIVGGAVAVGLALVLVLVVIRLPQWRADDPVTVTTPDPGQSPSPSVPPTSDTPAVPNWDRLPVEEEVSFVEPGDMGHTEDIEGLPEDLSICAVDVPSLGPTGTLTRMFTNSDRIWEAAVLLEFATAEQATAAREAIRNAYFNGCEPSGFKEGPQFLWSDDIPVDDQARPGEIFADLHRASWATIEGEPNQEQVGGNELAVVVQVGNRLVWLVQHLEGFPEYTCYAVDDNGGEICGLVRQVPDVVKRLL